MTNIVATKSDYVILQEALRANSNKDLWFKLNRVDIWSNPFKVAQFKTKIQVTLSK